MIAESKAGNAFDGGKGDAEEANDRRKRTVVSC